MPVADIAHDWRLSVFDTFARGLALQHTEAAEYCTRCGYLITGLNPELCPGRGFKLR